jgi:type VI secretion system secreted protein Hcp
MAFDAFLSLTGIPGESQDFQHKGETDILGFSFGVSQTVTWDKGGGGGAGKAAVQDMHFTKKVDAASPLLFAQCALGAHINSVVLTVRKAGGVQLTYFAVTLKNVLISSVKPHGQAQQNEYATPTELRRTQGGFLI